MHHLGFILEAGKAEVSWRSEFSNILQIAQVGASNSFLELEFGVALFGASRSIARSLAQSHNVCKCMRALAQSHSVCKCIRECFFLGVCVCVQVWTCVCVCVVVCVVCECVCACVSMKPHWRRS